MRANTASAKRRFPAVLLLMPAVVLLSACDRAVFNPSGYVALQQRDIIIFSTAIMLLIIVPVLALIVIFAWRYRAGSQASYDPDFDHSTSLELVIWSAPLLIIICLGALTWVATHLLDPYRPLATTPEQVVAANAKPLDVNVVALDWKWLFIYPEQGVATVNELALPVDRPVRFRISASSVMNMRRTCRRTLLCRSFSIGWNGFIPGTNSSAENSSCPSARQCRVAQGLSKFMPTEW